MNYYNEHDKFAAAWLRELIRQGCIPAGDVDERSPSVPKRQPRLSARGLKPRES